MKGFLNRKNIFLRVALGIFILFAADVTLLLVSGNVTDGKVVRNEYHSGNAAKSPPVDFPVVSFSAGNKTYRFHGNWETDYRPGDSVRVIYKPWVPRQAKIYTFWGVGKRPLIQFLLCLTVWYLIYSSFRQRGKKTRSVQY